MLPIFESIYSSKAEKKFYSMNPLGWSCSMRFWRSSSNIYRTLGYYVFESFIEGEPQTKIK